MLAILHGKERSVAEFDELLQAAGLRRTAVKLTHSPMSIIEATAASGCGEPVLLHAAAQRQKP